MESQASPRTIVKDGVAFAQLDDETVLLNTNTGVYFGVASVGTRIWTLLAEGLTDDQIRMSLLDEYDASVDTVAAELAWFMSELEDRDLVNRSAAVALR